MLKTIAILITIYLSGLYNSLSWLRFFHIIYLIGSIEWERVTKFISGVEVNHEIFKREFLF
ncbi:hypothetical protein Xvie_01297 [Xenorhabdus vietnamensis]|uniref:Uncharacterized protein n=1 Tax=Xenorhabdus vietnamensis TaxID=351656 RepID=A0A1Y2SGA5_9GAMM|nr:hypothetical protein Xvie_01297 [Xenorhabdus vietnamensis]